MKNFDHPMKRIKKCESKRLQKNLMNIIRPRSLILTLVGVLLVTFSVFAGTSILEGVVKDATGRPIKGADVRIEAKNFSKILKTDASGHYVTDGLAAGTYKVMLVINGQVKAVILDAKTQLDKPTQLNFDLSGKRASAKKHTRMVWIPSNIIGSNIIGGGRWVEVDDNGNIVDNTGLNNVEKFRRPAVYGKDFMPARISRDE
jgi:carboxypeptidase family protein